MRRNGPWRWGGLWLATLGSALAACSTGDQASAPDSRAAHAVSCRGDQISWSPCYAAATDICGPAGYDVLAINGDNSPLAAMTGGSPSASPTQLRSLVVACKGEKGR